MNRTVAAVFCLLTVGEATMNPARLSAQAASMDTTLQHAHALTQRSSSLTFTLDGKTTALSLADMQSMPQKTITVHNEHTKTDETYTGVALCDLLTKYGFPIDKDTHRKMLLSYLIAEGMDKYSVLYSITEVEPSEHNADVIVATNMNGKPLGEDGAFKLIDSADKKPQRWVRNLSAITVKTIDSPTKQLESAPYLGQRSQPRFI
jgi:hypothetical protein